MRDHPGAPQKAAANSGENAYRFRLHGAALLRDAIDEDVFDQLKRIYKGRSDVAHGSAADENEVSERARGARLLLAQAIAAVIELRKKGELDGNKIPTAVETLVRRRAARS